LSSITTEPSTGEFSSVCIGRYGRVHRGNADVALGVQRGFHGVYHPLYGGKQLPFVSAHFDVVHAAHDLAMTAPRDLPLLLLEIDRVLARGGVVISAEPMSPGAALAVRCATERLGWVEYTSGRTTAWIRG
jgi:SAM-dependent methyltransferase